MSSLPWPCCCSDIYAACVDGQGTADGATHDKALRMCAAAQVYPKMFLRGGTMYDTAWWGWLVKVWEVVVYNQLLDLQQCWQVLLSASCCSATPCPVTLLWIVRSHHQEVGWETVHESPPAMPASGACPAPLYGDKAALRVPDAHRSCCRSGRCCLWERSGTTGQGGGAGRGRRSRSSAAARICKTSET